MSNLSNSSVNTEDPDTIAMNPTDTGQQHLSVKQFYVIGIRAVIFGILVIFLLNLATPLEFVIDRFRQLGERGDISWISVIATRLFILCSMAALSCAPFLLILHKFLLPVSACIKQERNQKPIAPELNETARKRLLNLPFFMVPVFILLWTCIPLFVFFAAVVSDRMDFGTALVFSLRSAMVGVISAAIVFFGMEAHARKHLIPFFFPDGELSLANGTKQLSISRRIRAFFRVGSLIPLANIVMTLFILYWQVENDTVSAKSYGLGVLIFSVVVFILFFLASGFGNKLFARSISDPLGRILTAVEQVKKGNYNTRVKVVSNDEIGILGDATNQMIRGLQEKEMLREVFGRYVTPQIRDEVISGRIPLDGEYKEVTVLFADLKDFTAMTETRDPKQMVQILNAYFQEMDTAIKARSGLILQFLGDEIYAVFGAPVPCLNHAEQAFLTALEMTQGLVRLNQRFTAQGWPVLSHGIGIHTGKAVAASIGSPDRLSYLLVGDTINLASRLQSLTRSLNAKIIISADTVACLPPHLIQENVLKHSQSVQVKGRKVKIDIYLIF